MCGVSGVLGACSSGLKESGFRFCPASTTPEKVQTRLKDAGRPCVAPSGPWPCPSQPKNRFRERVQGLGFKGLGRKTNMDSTV